MKIPVLSYELDADLRLVSYHSRRELAAMTVTIGKPFLPMIGNSTLTTLLEVFFKSVLKTKKIGTAEYRCDTPHQRRYCSMEVYPLSGNGAALRVDNTEDRVENRPYVHLLDARTTFSNKLVCLCSWCKKMKTPDNRWTEIEDGLHEMHVMEQVPLPRITHGMCPECYAYVVDKIKGMELGPSAQPWPEKSQKKL